MLASVVTVQAGYTEAMAAEDFVGLAQRGAAPVAQRNCHLATVERLIANGIRGNHALAPAFSFNLESHRASRYKERLEPARLSTLIARILYRVTSV
jgi:hypothetical protein